VYVLALVSDMQTRIVLTESFAGFNGLELLAATGEYCKARRLIQRQAPGLIIVDRCFQLRVDQSLLRTGQDRSYSPLILYIDGSRSTSQRCLDAGPTEQMLKPLTSKALRNTLSDLLGTTAEPGAALCGHGIPQELNITVQDYQGCRRIPLSSIRYFQAEHKYVTVNSAGGSALTEISLSGLERLFVPYVLRIHRKTLIVRQHFEALQRQSDGSYRVRLAGSSDLLSVSRRQLASVQLAMQP
jgi:two-component system response regulator AlgR